MDAEQSARAAILDGSGLLAKLEDEQTVQSVTMQQLTSCKKKVAMALSPDKIRLMTNGSDAYLCGLQADSEASTSVEQLLRDLNVINAKLNNVVALVTNLQTKTAVGNAKGLDEAIEAARGAGISLPSSLIATTMVRAVTQAFADQDYDSLVHILQWKTDGLPEGAGSSEICIAAKVTDKDQAADLQVKLIMGCLLEAFRTADLKQQETALKTVVGLILVFRKVDLLSETFKKDVHDLVILADVVQNPSALRTAEMISNVATLRKGIEDNKNHRCYKVLCLLPAGRAFLAKVDDAMMNAKKDMATLTELSKLHASLLDIPLFAPKVGASELKYAYLAEHKKSMKDFVVGFLDVEGKLSDACKALHAAEIDACREHLRENFERLSIFSLDRAQQVMTAALASVNRALKVVGGVQLANVSLNSAVDAIGTSKSLGVAEVSLAGDTQELDSRLTEVKQLLIAIRAALPKFAEVAHKKAELDLRSSDVQAVIDKLSTRFVEGCSCTELSSFTACVRNQCRLALSSKFVEATAPHIGRLGDSKLTYSTTRHSPSDEQCATKILLSFMNARALHPRGGRCKRGGLCAPLPPPRCKDGGGVDFGAFGPAGSTPHGHF